MSDLYGLPIITSPNLPEGTVLLLNPEWSVLTPPTLFETETLYNGCRSFSMMFDLKINPRAFSIFGIDANVHVVSSRPSIVVCRGWYMRYNACGSESGEVRIR